MVNNVGQWTYDPNEPEKTRCDMDDVADIITKDIGYKPKNISIEDLCERIFADYEDQYEYEKIYDENRHLRIPELKAFISEIILDDYDYVS